MIIFLIDCFISDLRASCILFVVYFYFEDVHLKKCIYKLSSQEAVYAKLIMISWETAGHVYSRISIDGVLSCLVLSGHQEKEKLTLIREMLQTQSRQRKNPNVISLALTSGEVFHNNSRAINF